MNKKGSVSIKRGQAITFRLPSDTPDHILKQLQKLKETERRNFSSKIAEFILQGVNDSLSKDRETITLPLPKQLSKDQRSWLKHSHSEALLGSIVFQLLADPVRATSILASLNSNALDINEALYLQEDEKDSLEEIDSEENKSKLNFDEDQEELQDTSLLDDEMDDDLMSFNWEQAKLEHASTKEDDRENHEQEDVEDLLGGFLANMNK